MSTEIQQRSATIVNPSLTILLLSALLTTPLYAALSHDPSLHWKTLTSTHFEIHFHHGEEAIAREVAAIAEQTHARLVDELNWRPRKRTQLILTDRFDFSNGSATPFPRNTMTIIVTPPRSDSSVNDYNDWLDTLITHEYTHILHLDRRAGLPAGLQRTFGRLLPLFPNVMQPPWFIEGLATWHETDPDAHIGRGQSSQFRMLMRMEVAHGIKPVKQVNQPLESWPMNTVRYLYGVYFYQFVAERYGPDKVQELVEQYSDNIIPFMINNNSRRVLDANLTRLWAAFKQYLRDDFGAEIEAIRQRGESPAQQLTDYGYFTGMARLAGNGDLYFLRNDQQSEPRLMRLRRGQPPQAIGDMRGRHFDLHPEAGIVVAEIDATRSTNQFADLYHLDPRSGKKTQLTHGGRYLYAAWSPDGTRIAAVHNSGGQSALHLLDASGKLLDVLWQGEDHSVLGALDWSPDGQRLALPVWRRDSLWNLETFSLADRQWRMLTRSAGIETTPRYSRDGRFLLFSADYDGVYNIQRLDLRSGEIHTLSNLIGGAFAPIEAPDGSGLYFTGLGARGFDLYFLPGPQPRPVRHTAPATKPAPTTAAKAIDGEISDYSPLGRVAPTWWWPWLAFSDERSEIGFSTSGSDPLNRHNYILSLAYDAKNGWPVGRLDYIYDRWNPTLKLSAQRQVFALRDRNDKPVHYRSSDSLSLEALWPFFRYDRRWTLHAGLVSEIEADKHILPGFAPQPTLRDQLLGLAVSYDSSRRYARAISPSNGRQLRLIAEDNDALRSDARGQVYTLDWREFIDLRGEQVLAARLLAGWGTDRPRPFRLGGSLPDSRPSEPRAAALAPTGALFNRRRYALRGYAEGLYGLVGRRMGLLEVEWRFPIALIERGLMSPPIGLHRLHGTLFFNTGDAWNERFDLAELKSGLGAELTASVVLGYWLPVDLRLGYAHGLDDGGTQQIYLNLGASF